MFKLLTGSRNLKREFKKRGRWVTKFVIDGQEYGGDYDAMHDWRLEQFFRFFPTPERILELGSLEGGHSFSLASRPSVKYVLGIEGRPSNVERARFVQGLLQVTNVEFVTANLETTDLAAFGRFDAVFCCGLLYHLPEPWKLIEQIARVSRNLFIWTHYAREGMVDATAHGLKGMRYREFGLSYPLDGMSPNSFWPTLDGLQEMLQEYGFHEIHLIEDTPDHPHGPAVSLAATQV
jgi:SAM-dependent methyltransferase